MGRYEEIYGAADQTFTSATTAPDFATLMTAVQQKLGRHLATQVDSSNLFVQVGLSRVRVACSSRFEGGVAQEQFVWVIRDGWPHLVSYTINSPALILK